MLKNRIKLSIAALGLSFAMVACGSIFSPVAQRKIVTYELADSTISNPTACSLAASKNRNILFISPMHANAPYNSVQIYYGEKPYELNTFSYSEWVSSPTDLLTQMITKKVITSCLFAGIATGNALANANYRLTTQLITLRQQIDSNHAASVKLVIYSQLVDLNSNKVLSSKIFNEQITSAVGPQPMVEAANKLLVQFNDELVVWLKQNSHH